MTLHQHKNLHPNQRKQDDNNEIIEIYVGYQLTRFKQGTKQI